MKRRKRKPKRKDPVRQARMQQAAEVYIAELMKRFKSGELPLLRGDYGKLHGWLVLALALKMAM